MTAARAPERLRIHLLGPFEIRGAPASLAGARPLANDRLALLAFLALAPGQVRRDTLRALFWPAMAEEDAWRELNQAVFDLRHALGEDALMRDSVDAVALDRSIVACDAVEFEDACRTGDLDAAMTLYRGEFLWDVYLAEPAELGQWISLTRARLRAKAATACTTLAMDFADRDARAALDWSRRAYEIERSEGSLRRLMVLHDALGDASGALRHYDRFAKTLRAERGIDPAPETQRLVAEIRDSARLPSSTPVGEPRLLGEAAGPGANHRPRRVAIVAGALTTLLAVAAIVVYARRVSRDGADATQSRTALAAYRAGETDLHAGRFEAAVQSFKHAVTLDSSYAMAYFRLSEAANWTGESGLAGDAADRAVRLAGRLPSADRTRVDAWSLYLRGQANSAERLYSGMLAADSADADAWFSLAEIQFHWGPMFGTATQRSAAAWDHVLALDPRNAGALIHRLRIAAMAFDRPTFESLAARLNDLTPSADREAEVRGLRAFAFGDAAAQSATARDVGALDMLRKSLVREMLLSARDLRGAGRQLVPVLFTHQGFSSWEQGDLLLSAQTEAATGDLTRALAVIDSAALLQPDRALEYRAMLATIEDLPVSAAWRRAVRRELDSPVSKQAVHPTAPALRRYLAATLDAHDGKIPSARAQLAALQAMAPRGGTSADSTLARHVARLSRIAAAEIARAEGHPADAVALLGEPTLEPDLRIPYVWSYPRAHERFLRGELAAALGHSREAAAWFETFPDPGAYDLPYLPWALRRRADLAEKTGDAGLAKALRTRANQLWTPTSGTLSLR